jgi:hypothetical protein
VNIIRLIHEQSVKKIAQIVLLASSTHPRQNLSASCKCKCKCKCKCQCNATQTQHKKSRFHSGLGRRCWSLPRSSRLLASPARLIASKLTAQVVPPTFWPCRCYYRQPTCMLLLAVKLAICSTTGILLGNLVNRRGLVGVCTWRALARRTLLWGQTATRGIHAFNAFALLDFRHGSYLLSAVHGGLQFHQYLFQRHPLEQATYISRCAMDNVLAFDRAVV